MKTDFEKFGRICQLENIIKYFFICFLFYGCATDIVDEKKEERLIKPAWLKIDKEHSFRDKNDDFIVHPFFDVTPEITKETEIPYIAITPEKSHYEYRLNMLSGALYKVREFCKTEDIWDSYSGDILYPNFTLGIIPQTFDALGEPQKIIVFKSNPNVSKFEFNIRYYHEATILGSILIETCDSYPCQTRDRWKQSQILVSVDRNDPEYNYIETFTQLKRVVNWNYTKAFVVNGYGSHKVGSKYYPASRINAELSHGDTMKMLNKKSVKIDLKKEMEFRDNCVRLFDESFKNIQMIRAAKTLQQENFLKYFKEFFEKDSKLFYACQKVVRPANINEDPERHWFYEFITSFIGLERSGLYFSCAEKGWSFNPKVDDEHFYIDQTKEINRCRAKDFEKSFDQSINGMSLLKSQLNKYFHYIEYDSAHGGSHQKIYSWIIDDVKKIPCETEKMGNEIFPQDVVWPAFKEDEVKTVH
jgi:hypothetical protein